MKKQNEADNNKEKERMEATEGLTLFIQDLLCALCLHPAITSA